MLRVALIGCGEMGALRARAMASVAELRLAAVADVDAERADRLASAYGAEAFSDWQRLLDQSQIEIAVVSTRPDSHAEICTAALSAGVHVLCEKPLARSSEEARGILDAAASANRRLATGFNFRFYPSVVEAKRLIVEGRIGEVTHLRGYAGYSMDQDNHGWLRDADVVGGGALWDIGIHLIDLAGYFVGEPETVRGLASNRILGIEGCEDNGFLLMKTRHGTVATLHASWTEFHQYRFELDISGTRGSIRLSCFPMMTRAAWVDQSSGQGLHSVNWFPLVQVMERLRSYEWVVIRSLVREFELLVDEIDGRKTELASGADGEMALRIAEAADMLGDSLSSLTMQVVK